MRTPYSKVSKGSFSTLILLSGHSWCQSRCKQVEIVVKVEINLSEFRWIDVIVVR